MAVHSPRAWGNWTFAVLRISELLYSISRLCHNYWMVDIYEGVRNCTVHALASRPLLTTTLPLSS